LYRLTAEQIAALSSETTRVDKKTGETKISVRQVGEKTASSIMRSIEESKNRGLAAVLGSIGARFLGITNGRKLAAWASDIATLQSATIDDLRRALRDADESTDGEKSLLTLAGLIHEALAVTQTLLPATDVEQRLGTIKPQPVLSRRLNEARMDLLVSRFASVEELDAASVDEITAALRPNARTAEVIYDFFQSHAGRSVFEQLVSLGVRLVDAVSPGNESKLLAGKSIVVTGTLERFGRAEIEDLIVSLGGKPSASVSKKTAFVVAGANAGSKLDKAIELGVEVIDENEFAKRIKL